jgi:hypothetical protein
MSTDTLMELVPARQSSTYLGDLVRFVNRQTQQQVQDLSIHHGDGGLVVTGRSPTYYVQQLVTQAIQMSAPAVRLVNAIRVG